MTTPSSTAIRRLKQPGDDNELVFKILRVRILTMAERYADAETECKAPAQRKSASRRIDRIALSALERLFGRQTAGEVGRRNCRSILKIDPDNATVNNDLGYLWADQGKNLAVAEEMIRKALDLDRSQRRKKPEL